MEKGAANTLRNFLINKEETIAVAESVTSGKLQTYLASSPKAQQFYQGGITAYNIGQKYKHLFVEPIHAARCNCVSGQVAEQMSVHVCELFQSDWGIGITGYATAEKESGNKIFCHYAICHHGTIVTSSCISSRRMSPAKVQDYYVEQVIKTLVEIFKDERKKT